jgi:hypothetical protein
MKVTRVVGPVLAVTGAVLLDSLAAWLMPSIFCGYRYAAIFCH